MTVIKNDSFSGTLQKDVENYLADRVSSILFFTVNRILLQRFIQGRFFLTMMKCRELLVCAALFMLLGSSCQTHHSKSTDDNNLLLGNPSNATSDTLNADNYLIDHHYYVESYSRARGEPNWVSWHISARDLGVVERSDDFRPDSIVLPGGWFVADNTSYRGSGFDRGHNCPSGDRTSSTDANSATFLMDNMIPQAPNNNRHTWEHLEVYCREQVKKGNEAFIIMGSYGEGGVGKLGFRSRIAKGHIEVPAHIWKIIVLIPEGDDDLDRIAANAEVIAVDTPNINAVSSYWKDYVCTVRDIEQATGYAFFRNLPEDIKNRLEDEKFNADDDRQ